MLSLLKKSPDKSGKGQSTGWHPNFRDVTQLPDTKVVRTSFFVNGLAALVLLSLATFVAYQEYTLSELNRQFADWDASIARDQRASAQAVALFKTFQSEQKKLADAEAFVSADKFVVTEFMTHLGQTLPRNVSLSLVDYSPSGVIVRGAVRAQPDQASGIASAFEKRLKDDPEFGAKFASVSLTNLVPDVQAARLNFEISMKFATGGKKK